uniref:Uncharacterized protein n=1 Tax=Triticum urartu TaxID=4572 RepID=A0A8R7K1J0_TRIUA
MGAQDEGSRRPPPPGPAPGQSAATAGTAPPPITPAQFLSWKQRKVDLPLFFPYLRSSFTSPHRFLTELSCDFFSVQRLAKCAVISWWFPLARPWKSLVICGLLSGCTPVCAIMCLLFVWVPCVVCFRIGIMVCEFCV